MGERAPFRAVRRPRFVSSPTPSRAMVSIRTVSVASHNEAKKVGAVIYLSTNRPLHLPDFLAEFHQSWPHLLLQKTGKEPHRALFRVGKSDFALELITRPSRKRLLGPSVHATRHWPEADAVLAGHQAHRSVAESAENRGVLSLAWDRTKAIAALLPVPSGAVGSHLASLDSRRQNHGQPPRQAENRAERRAREENSDP
jgi:hypothetical protein